MWYDHQFLHLRDTFAKNRQTWQKMYSFSRFTDLEKKNRKTKNVGTCKPLSKFVKCEKLYIFCFGCLKKRVNE